ncbi:MAG TPA: sensor histidine kinase N-terminal domain-containing protein [Burkholderiaceae bacterium]|nr:sensor histidine kinase N-terminal domain-containing protein [Burkholderiaceae bacterium]
MKLRAAVVDSPTKIEARSASAVPSERSLFGEILDWMLAPLLLIWPLSIAATYLIAQSIADAPFDRAMEASVRVLAQQIRFIEGPAAEFSLPIAARDILHADETDTMYFQVLGMGGQFLGGEADLPLPPDEVDPPLGVVRFRNQKFKGAEVRVAYLYVGTKSRAPSPHVARPPLVQVAETLDKRSKLANEIIKGVNLPQFLILPVAVLLVWAGLSRGIRPLRTLANRIHARRPDDLSRIDPREAPQEVAPLVHAFNDMLDRVSNAVRAQQRFIADAAHQMKTPLAGLRTQAELALRQDDPDELKRSLRQLATSSERATHLINQLLALARAEGQAEESKPRFELLDLADVARAAVIPFFDAAWAKQIDLGFESVGRPVLVRGHPLLLAELIKNLLDNALRYTPSGGRITVRVTAEAMPVRALLQVEDSGPGIPEVERALVFERFYRVLGSGQDGSGLGLAIVREIAQQHKATIDIGHASTAATTRHDAAETALPGCLITVVFDRQPVPIGYDD